jgi:general secretion pathway protein G
MKRTRKTTARRSGFTLIELLLVLVILAVLAALVIPKFTNRSRQARETAVTTDIATISNTINTFEVDTGRFPTSLNDLLTAPASVQGWKGPYLDRAPKDPWGNPYVYKYPGQRNANGFDLYSMGEDGREGTDDLGNWEK